MNDYRFLNNNDKYSLKSKSITSLSISDKN
jgi:hypothetical protein